MLARDRRLDRFGLLLLCAAVLFPLYGYVAWASPGFDDEIYNISLIEKVGTLGTVRITQTSDVHPPGSYLLNGVLYDVLGRWPAVRLCSGLLNVIAVLYFVAWVFDRRGARPAALALLTLGLSPGLLLWGTSVRWYAYFVPVVTVLCVVPSNHTSRWYWAKLFLGLAVLGYTSYAVAFVAPALVAWHHAHAGTSWKASARRAWPFAAVATVAYLPQLWVLLTVHMRDAGPQVGSLPMAALGVFVSVFSNQGVFPVSIGALCSATGVVLVYACLYRTSVTRKELLTSWAPMSMSLLLIAGSGFAAKFRNLVITSPLQAISMSWHADAARCPLFVIAVGLVLTGNALGLHNVATHQATTKNSWNMPVGAVLDQLDKVASRCAGDVVVATHDPVLAYTIQHARTFPVVSFHPSGQQAGDRLRPPGRDIAACLAVLRTFRGSIERDTYRQMIASESGLRYDTEQHIRLGFDRDASIKRWVIDDVPDYLVEIDLFEHVSGLDAFRRTWTAQ